MTIDINRIDAQSIPAETLEQTVRVLEQLMRGADK